MKKEINYNLALKRAAALCSKAEKCEKEMEQKLADWNLPKDEAMKVLDFLIEEKYIDNDRFCGAYIRDKFRYSRWGKIKIRYHLKQKNIASTSIKHHLDEDINNDEYIQCLCDLLHQKSNSIRDEEVMKRKEKIIRFVVSRGFELDLILQHVDKYL